MTGSKVRAVIHSDIFEFLNDLVFFRRVRVLAERDSKNRAWTEAGCQFTVNIRAKVSRYGLLPFLFAEILLKEGSTGIFSPRKTRRNDSLRMEKK
jgi:hypothetical protein